MFDRRAPHVFIRGVKRLLPTIATLLSSASAEIRINEIMASNTRAFPDVVDFEDYPDWLELHNSGTESEALDAYYLSDDLGEPLKWRIPDGTTIPAGGYLLVMADSRDSGIGESHPRGYWPWRNFLTDRLHANFSLSSVGEAVVLTRVIDQSESTAISFGAEWKFLDDGSSQGEDWKQRTFDDSLWFSGPAPLGYGDDPATPISYGTVETDRHITSYFRRSFEVVDPTDLASFTARFQVDDACIVYLNGVEVIRHNLPEGPITSETTALVSVAPPNEEVIHSYTFRASELVVGTNTLAVEVHQNGAASVDLRFDLELIGRTAGTATPVDSVTYGQQVRDVPLGRGLLDPENFYHFAEATPGAPNSAAIVNDIRLESSGVEVSPEAGLYDSAQLVTLESDAGLIYYTLDGSNPTTSETLYSGPFLVSDTAVVRARCYETGKVPGPIVSRTFFIGETFTNLPYVSITADPDTLFGNDIGIYTNTLEPSGNVYKRKDAPGHAEFFPVDGSKGFAVNGGIRIGGENNWASHEQKALNFALKGKYGDDVLKYDLFPGSGIPLHTGFSLREGGDNYRNALLRDSLWWYLAADDQLEVETTARRPVVAFVNGQYWGIYNLRDRWNEQWFHEHYGVDDGNYDHNGYGHFTSRATTLGAHHGTTDEWNALFEEFIKVRDLTLPENWAFIESRIDIDSYLDFVICESYANNTSWRHNREFWKERRPGAKWRWMVPDMDRTWQTMNLERNILGDMSTGSGILSRLLVNQSFRERLAQRYAAHIQSTFSVSRMHPMIDELGALLDLELDRHVIRWTDSTTRERYQTQLNEIKTYALNRAPLAMNQIASLLQLETAVSLPVSLIGSGEIRVAGVKIREDNLALFGGVPATIEAIPAPGFQFSHWSGSVTGEASTTFIPQEGSSVIANFVADNSTVVGGELTTDTTWTSTNSPYVISEDLIIPTGVTLTIEAGVEVSLTKSTHVRVAGTLLVNGTSSAPVSMRGRNRESWGGISFEQPATSSSLNHLVIREATRGEDPTVYPAAISGLDATLELNFIDIAESRSPLFFRGGSLTLRDSFIHIPLTGDGLNVKQGAAITERCTFLGNDSPDTDAIDYDGVVNGIIRDCRIYRFLGFNSDGIDTGEQCVNVLIEGNRIFFNSDKGVSVGQGSSVIMRKNLIVGCLQGVGVKDEGSTVLIDQNTFVDCEEAVSVFEKNFGAGGSTATVTNTIFSDCPDPVKFDGLSSVQVTYSLSDTAPLFGTGNLNSDPRFIDPLALDFGLQGDSPAINSGDPAHEPDPDGSIVDRGADYTFDPNDYPFNDLNTVVINEVLANSGEQPDWIELHNRTNAAIDISGWFLSDDGSDLLKYRIPEGTLLEAGGFITFFEDLHFSSDSNDPGAITPFALSNSGETVHLSSAVDNSLTGYRFSENFGASFEGETLGFHFKPSTGTYNFVRLQSATLSGVNAAPVTGPLAITEIMYNVNGDEDSEYFEITNLTSGPVSLDGWKISRGIDFAFPAGATIAARERIILTRNSTAFANEFTAPAATQIFQWTDGKLSNSGDTLQIDAPGMINEEGEIDQIRIDRVNYGTESPWDEGADGTGLALVRVTENSYGNEVLNWSSAAPSPGTSGAGTTFEDWANGLSETGDEDGDGLDNFLEYALGTDPFAPDESPAFGLGYSATGITLALETILARTDVELILQSSNDLDTWTPLDLTPVNLAAGVQERRLSLSAGIPEIYFRVVARKR